MIYESISFIFLSYFSYCRFVWSKLYRYGEQKYGIATNNVPVDAVSTVEVIENHQPVNMLKNMIASTKAAINIKLKKDRKIRPVRLPAA
ncbi:hypothetical protein FACS1894174_08150 [Bacteroidia bacterium]|nr:hypothetical protein FACS1894174_08150 [Bacteroidia bacterium]